MVEELALPACSYEAFLFDLDGTVADSMPLHFVAWTRAVEEAGGQFPEALFYAMGGIPLLRTVELLNERFGTAMVPEAVGHRKETLFLAMLDRMRPVPSVLRVIEAYAGKLPFAIVSGSSRASIAKTLDILGMAHYFPVVVGAEDVVHGKPAPEPFLKAATLLGVVPKTCLVFEDADAGIEAAKAAGMDWVRVPQGNEFEYGATT